MWSLVKNNLGEIITISTASAVFGGIIYELFKLKEKSRTTDREKAVSFATAFLSATLVQILVLKSKK
jgi:hypothetical protein